MFSKAIIISFGVVLIEAFLFVFYRISYMKDSLSTIT